MNCLAACILAELAPPAAGSTIIPVAIEPDDTGQSIHTVALFPGSVAAGTVAAQQLAAKLRAGGLNAYFDQRKFRRVHAEVVADPYLVRCGGWQAGGGSRRAGAGGRQHSGRRPGWQAGRAVCSCHLSCTTPWLQADSTGDTIPSLPGSRPVAMITVKWYDLAPDQVTAQKRKAYVAAIHKLVPGAQADASSSWGGPPQ